MTQKFKEKQKMLKKLSTIPFQGTKEQEQQLNAVIEKYKGDKSRLMAAMQEAQGKGKREEVNLAALPTMAKGSRECLLEIPMQEPRTTVVYNIMERCKYTERNNIACAILNSVMDTRCTSLLREEQGGTYGVSVVVRISRQPKQEVTMMFNFTSNAQQAKPLLESALKILKQIASEGVTNDEFEKARQQLIKQHDAYRNSNAFWLNVITQQVTYGYSDTLSYNDALQHVKPADVVRMARLLSKSKNTVELIMNGKGI